MHIRIFVVQEYGVVSGHHCPAFDAWNHGRFASDFGFFLNSSCEFGADKAFVDEVLTWF